MKKEIADKWVEALRSGKYKQGRSNLKVNGAFCCLGVLCELSGLGEFKPSLPGSETEEYLGAMGLPGPEVCKWAELKDSGGALPCPVRVTSSHLEVYSTHLYGLNDQGMPFWQIADVIEKHWEAL